MRTSKKKPPRRRAGQSKPTLRPPHRRSRLQRGSILVLREPRVLFHHSQALEDPRDGLTLFGPLEGPFGLRIGVIGTLYGIRLYRAWAERIRGPLANEVGSYLSDPHFPGFESAFRIPWQLEPALTIEVDPEELDRVVHHGDPHQRVFATVALFAEPIVAALRNEEVKVDVWFVVIPDVVHENCRPRSRLPLDERTEDDAPAHIRAKEARELFDQPSLFAEDHEAATPYYFEVDFHNQLKARLLGNLAPTQIVRESTLAFPPKEVRLPPGRDKRKLQAAVAWSLSTAAFYKAGGKPWKIAEIRKGVCYVGLVFKQDVTQRDPRMACCAAQMFLDSGDGTVFRGAVGPWHSSERHEFHLSHAAARELIAVAVASYVDKAGHPPRELFIHGKAYFEDEEWAGFQAGVDARMTTLVGVRIRDTADLRLYRPGTHPVLRGTALVRGRNSAYLWTRGFAPLLRTYVGREVPKPLRIDVLRGTAELRKVLADILALTKLNFNTCIFADGLPVTLRFADAVGEILTAGPVGQSNPLAFKYYI
ncbi:MAG: hypothetical protein V1907_01265 [Candidatus Kerfeldbacteria bacterium]